MCCMLSMFHVLSRFKANICESSLLFFNSSLGLTGGKDYPQILNSKSAKLSEPASVGQAVISSGPFICLGAVFIAE